MTSDFELRQATALLCSDALKWTRPMTDEAQGAIQAAVHRLVSAEPMTEEDERLICESIIGASGCETVGPLDHLPAPSWEKS